MGTKRERRGAEQSARLSIFEIAATARSNRDAVARAGQDTFAIRRLKVKGCSLCYLKGFSTPRTAHFQKKKKGERANGECRQCALPAACGVGGGLVSGAIA